MSQPKPALKVEIVLQQPCTDQALESSLDLARHQPSVIVVRLFGGVLELWMSDSPGARPDLTRIVAHIRRFSEVHLFVTETTYTSI